MRKKDFNNLMASIRQTGRIRRGQAKPSRVIEFAPVDVKAIRQRLRQSQAQFARMIGVSVATLQNWEQGRRRNTCPSLPRAARHEREVCFGFLARRAPNPARLS